MKHICLFVNINLTFDEKSINEGCGGSETWVIKLAETLGELNNKVTIITNCETHQQNENIFWYSLDESDKIFASEKFDAIIVSRIYTRWMADMLQRHNCANIYFMAHDTYLIDDNVCPIKYTNFNEWEKENIKKVFILSKAHKQLFINEWKFPENKLELTANGLDFELLEKYSNNETRDNNILWSIRYERHFNILVDKLAPTIRQYIPDFKVYTCSYGDPLPEQYKHYDYIVDLGKLSKDELYKEMSKHKICFHPMLFFETFCISILEAIMSGCNIVTGFRFGAATTLMPYKGFLLPDDINYDSLKDCKYVATVILGNIFEYNSKENKALRESMQTYLKNQYSWKKIAKDMLKVMNLND